MTKPHIVCHMVSSLDGRLSPSNWTASPDGDRNDWSAAYAVIHEKLKGEAWIVGRVTMAEIAKGVRHAPAVIGAIDKPLYFAPHGHAPYAIALDASARLHFDRADIDGDHIVVLLGRDVSDSHLAELKADGISYIASQTAQLELPAMLDVLGRELGIRRLLLEGGGGINGSFFAAGLVDELSVIVAPALDGRSGGKSIVDSGEVGLAGKVELSLTSCDKLEHGAIHLLYAVKPNQPKC